MKIFKRTLFYILLLLSLLTAGCEYEANENESFSFMVVSSGDKVTGYYIENGDPSTWTYYETTEVDSTGYYEFRKNLVAPSSVRIFADQLASSATITSVQIYIYENGQEVSSVSDTITQTDDSVSATLYYDFTSKE